MSKLQSQASESPPCQPKSLSRVHGKPLNHPHSSSRCLSTLVPRNSSTHAEIQTHPALTLGISPELTLLKHQTRLTEPVAFPPNPMFLVSGNGRTEHSPALLGNSKRDSLGPSSLPFLTITCWVSLILLLYSCQTLCKCFSLVVQVFLSDKF